MGKCGGVAENNQFHACTGHGDIHAAEVAEETDLTLFVAANQRYNDDVAFLSLKSIDGVDGDGLAERFQFCIGLDERTDVLGLYTVGADDADVEPLVEKTVDADFLNIFFQAHSIRLNRNRILFLCQSNKGRCNNLQDLEYLPHLQNQLYNQFLFLL